MSAVCFCPSSLLSASDVGSSSTLIGYRGQASRVGALKVQISELRALARWARYCVYVRNYVRLTRVTPLTRRFIACNASTRLYQWFPMQKCRILTPLTRVKAAACFSVGVTLLRKIYSKQFMLPFRLRVLPSNLPPEQ